MKNKKETDALLGAKYDAMETVKRQTEKYSPMPWKVGGTMRIIGDSDLFRRIDDRNGILVALVSDKNLTDTSVRDGIAEKIKVAVNSHETLLEAVRETLWAASKNGNCLSLTAKEMLIAALAQAEKGL